MSKKIYFTDEARKKIDRIRAAKFRKEHPEIIKERKRIWRLNNLHKIAIYRSSDEYKKKNNERSAKWRKENPEKYLKWFDENTEKLENWRKSNKEKTRRYWHDHKALKLSNGGKLSPGLEAKLLSFQKGQCAICKKSLRKAGHNMDHIVPLIRGGKNADRNIQLTCPKCNRKKGAKDPIIFMQSQGFLL